MNIILNGQSITIDSAISLKTLAEQQQLDVDKIVIEYNSDIPDKTQYETIVIQDGDQIEFVQFVGGG